MIDKYFKSPRGKIFYQTNDDKGIVFHDTIVFLHGLTADHSLFDGQIPFFADKHRILVWDAPAHGKSRPYTDFSYPNAAADLKEILDENRIEKAIFVGQSMGGYIIQSFYQRYPQYIQAFIGIDTCPFGTGYYSRSDKWWLRQIEWMSSLYPLAFLKKSIAKQSTFTPTAYQNMLTALTPYPKRELCHLMGIGFSGFLDDNCDLKITCPTLIICGENDITGKVKQYCRAWSQATGFDLVWIKKAAHNANVDNPEDVNNAIQNFLSTLPDEKFSTTTSKKPLIGISGNFNGKETLLAQTYINAVVEAGGCPLIIPPCTQDEVVMSRYLEPLDGLLFSGGGDFDPIKIGEKPIPSVKVPFSERDDFEFPIFKMAMERQLPILGICRGEQLMNLALGGRIYQDIASEFNGSPLSHSQTEDRDITVHQVSLEKDSLLDSLFEKNTLDVNSFHHQAVKTVAPSLRVSAYGSDGIIEAVESAECKPLLGVQWHPECLTQSKPEMKAIFDWFIQESNLYRQARKIQQNSVSIDLHCDAPMFFEGNYDLYRGGNIERGKIDFDAQGDEKNELVDSRVDVRKMELGEIDGVIMAAYLKQLNRDEEGLEAAKGKAIRLLNEIQTRAQKYTDHVGIARNANDILRLKQQGKRALLMGIENAYALGKDLRLVDTFADMGVSYITLCHNGHNDVCDSASQQDRPEHNGISAFGKEVVKAMNRRGLIIDLSHASEKSFYDALEYSQAPIIASHSSAYALCEHRRNLKDDQIKALAKKGGMMGICLYEGFLQKGSKADIHTAVKHIDHICQLVGVDYVGIGSDFDGGGGIVGCNNTAEIFNLTRELLRAGYSSNDISKILGGNFLRVMNTIQLYASK